MMAKLIPESQTDWARLDKLATPKSLGGHGAEPNAFLSTGASWSQSSGMLGFEAAAMPPMPMPLLGRAAFHDSLEAKCPSASATEASGKA